MKGDLFFHKILVFLRNYLKISIRTISPLLDHAASVDIVLFRSFFCLSMVESFKIFQLVQNTTKGLFQRVTSISASLCIYGWFREFIFNFFSLLISLLVFWVFTYSIKRRNRNFRNLRKSMDINQTCHIFIKFLRLSKLNSLKIEFSSFGNLNFYFELMRLSQGLYPHKFYPK